MSIFCRRTPGNSGGPLLATDGTVLGVTSVIFSPSGGSVGLGFAIPAETVALVIAQLEAHGRVDRGYIGVTTQALTRAIAKALGLTTPSGALITAVDPKSPAQGILNVGDVLLSMGSSPTGIPTRIVKDAVDHGQPKTKPIQVPQYQLSSMHCIRDGHLKHLPESWQPGPDTDRPAAQRVDLLRHWYCRPPRLPAFVQRISRQPLAQEIGRQRA